MTITEARQILGLPENYDEAMLKSAHRKAAKKAHPDLPGGSEALFVKITEAYNTLRNPTAATIEMRVTHNGILDVVVI